MDLSNHQISNYVIKYYRTKLQRNPSDNELRHFIGEIQEGRITVNQFLEILENCQERTTLINSNSDILPEPKFIFVSCFNDKSGNGGLFKICNENMTPIIEGPGCFGLNYNVDNNILFCLTRTDPQILAFKITPDGEINRIPIKFSNYNFANDAHGILVHGDKVYAAATQGESPPKEAKKKTDYGNFVGKIIVSDIDIADNLIEICNSRIINPFNCDHHHHVNDLCNIGNEIYFTAFSYCDSTNEDSIENGCIAKLDLGGNSRIITENLERPHSITVFKERMYVASSSKSQILSSNLHGDTDLEYKGPNAFVRGLLVTENYIYYGTSWGLGRTNSRFTNTSRGVLRFDKVSGETVKFSIPEQYDNIYSIISDWP